MPIDDLPTIVSEADAKLGTIVDIQRTQLEETKGLRADINRILDRLASDPPTMTGPGR